MDGNNVERNELSWLWYLSKLALIKEWEGRWRKCGKTYVERGLPPSASNKES